MRIIRGMADAPEPEWSFSDRLRKLRRDYTSMSQREFADSIGISQPTYAAWESGTNAEPREFATLLSVARRISVLTGVSVAWILNLDGDELASQPAPKRPR